MACTVPGCGNRVSAMKENNANVSFHRFPADTDIKNIWIKNVRKGDNWRPTQHTRICSAHFEDSCFREGCERRVLFSHAVPTIFPKLPASSQSKLPLKRKLIAKYDDAVPSTSSGYENKLHGILPKMSRKTQTETTDANKGLEAELAKARKLAQHYKIIAIRRGRKFKNIQKKYNRLVKKKADLETIIQALHQKMEDEHVEILKNTLDVKNQFVSRYLLKLRGGSLPNEYPDEVKKFALTLHFLSPKAYNYVRDSFETVLPHPKTLSRWYKSVDCKPGFTKESLDIIRLRSTCANKTLYCALVIDEVAIRKQLQWDGNKYYGHIDFGSEVVGDDLPLASEALTFMVTCINESWKIPVGYFLINGLSAQQKRNLVEQCLRLLKDSVTVVSLTFDGAAGTSVLNSRRKTGFIGFQICIISILFIYDKYVATINSHLRFLPIYKLSQDHLEIFFGAIRSLGGFNNNPSAKAFMTAYKKLLVHAEFKVSRNGNCLPLDDIRVLHTSKRQYIQAINDTTQRAKNLDDELKTFNENHIDHDYIPDPSVLTEYSDNVITYISGFIVRRMKKDILCEECVKALNNETSKSCLLKVKDRGGLIKASSDVVYICKSTEKIFRRYLLSVGVCQIGKPFYIEKITMTVFEICARSDVFSQLISHCYDNCILNNRLHLIIKAVVNFYLKIRIHHECKKASAPDGEIVRNYYNKLVLFKGQ